MANIYLPPIARKKKVDGNPRYVLIELFRKYLIPIIIMLSTIKSFLIHKINSSFCSQVIRYSFPVEPLVGKESIKKTSYLKAVRIRGTALAMLCIPCQLLFFV